MVYKYTNLKTNSEIEINLSKKYSFIYGPNGTGKTTFARSIQNGTIIEDNGILKKHLVFSQDFVNNNIYITTSDNGYKTDTNNKSRLKQIFLGNSSKEDNEKLIFIRRKIREYSRLKIEPSSFKDDFKTLSIKILENCEEYNKNYEKFLMNYIDDSFLKKYVENLFNSIEKDKFIVDIMKIDDETYTNSLVIPTIQKTYSTNEISIELLKFLKESYNNQEKSINSRIDKLNIKIINTLTEPWINEKIKNFNEIILKLQEKENDYRIALKLKENENEFLENILGKDSSSKNKATKWISEGHDLHTPINFSKCLYCRNTIDEQIKSDYKTILENTYMNYLKKFTDELMQLITFIDEIKQEYNELLREDWYTKTCRKKETRFIKFLIYYMEKIKSKYKKEYETRNYYKNIINDLQTLLKFIKNINTYFKIVIKEDTTTKNTSEKPYQLYFDSEKLQNQIKTELIKYYLQIAEKNLTTKIKTDTTEYIEKIKKHINIFEEIYQPRIRLNISPNLSRADNVETTIELVSDERNFLNNISEGEKNVLALTIFFSYVKNELDNIKENEKLVIILDDPVNSNDWNNFFIFQSIIEDLFYYDVNKTNKIDNIIILSHNIDYAVIQLQNDKYTQRFELLRLFSNKCEKIETDFIFIDDIKLGSKLINDLLINTELDSNIVYLNKTNLYRVAIYMRKFLETFITGIICITNPNLKSEESEEKCIKFLKDNIDSDNIKILLDMSTKIIKDTQNGAYDVNTYMKVLINALNDMVSNYKVFKNDSILTTTIIKFMNKELLFKIRDDFEHKIIADTFKIDYSLNYEQVLIDTMIKAMLIKVQCSKEANLIEYTKKQSEKYFLNYLRHINDNVGRPVLAVNSDFINNN